MKYVCLLRGINVSGKNLIRMAALTESFEALGFAEVDTYVQSGNVVFETKRQPPAALARTIRDRIDQDFGLDVPVVVRSAAELERVVAANPFARERGMDTTKLHRVLGQSGTTRSWATVTTLAQMAAR